MDTVLLESSLRAVVMFAAMAAVLALFRVRSGAARHAAWSAVLLTMLLLPAWTAWGPEMPLRVLPAAPLRAEYLPTEVTQPLAAEPIAQRPVHRVPMRSQSTSWSWQEIAVGIYALVALGMFTRLLIGTMRAGEIVRNATLSDGTLTSPLCAAPITVGWLKPAIILPTDWTSWTPQQQEAVLLHEQEHVRRRDSLIQWFALLNCCIFWFHPLAWWLERKLNVLAEEACDDVVLGRGHSPQDYSTYLIDIARNVKRSGARVSMGFAYRDRTLAHRVQRILAGRPTAAITRSRAALISTATAAILIASTACTLDRSEQRAAGEPTMNELMHRRADQNREQQAREEAMKAEVKAMTPQQAQALEDRLKANPDDRDTYLKMVRYYQRVVDVQKLAALYLWLYEHQPDGKVYAGSINPEWDRASYEKGKQIWLANLKKPNPSAETYRRAATYFKAGDKPLAEQTLLDGETMYPAEDWSTPLGRLYAQALAKGASDPFAQRVRAKLATTNDPDLLVQTALARTTGNPPDFDTLELARRYVDRALSIQPNHLAALHERVQVDDIAAAMKARRLPAEQLTVSERMRALRMKLYQPFNAAEPAAHELLRIAASNPMDPEYGNAIFFANQLLGEAALQRKDKKAAVQFLQASMGAPATDRLRYGHITVNLAGSLVDWGERTTVAEFLEHCAKFNQFSREFYDLSGWAAQIRAGKNPELFPYHYRGE